MSEASDTLTFVPDEPPRPRPRWVDVGVILAVTPILLAAIRVLLFSGGDPALFRVLVQTLNVPTVLLGTAIAILPVAALYPLVWFATEPSALLHFARAPWFGFAFLAYVGVVLAYVTLGPWPAAGWMALLAATAFIAFWLLRRFRHGLRVYRRGLTLGSAFRAPTPMTVRPPTEAWKSSAWVLVGTLALGLVGLQSMWLPMEKIALTTGDEMTGFVLEEKTEWTTVLTDQRAVYRIATDTVDARTVCDQGEFASLVMNWARSAPEDPPTC